MNLITYNLSLRARRDLKQIGSYTRKTWGSQQMNAYITGLHEKFEVLSRQDVGRGRSEISEGLKSMLYHKHVIFYRLRDDGVFISRIVHQAEDIQNYLGDL